MALIQLVLKYDLESASLRFVKGKCKLEENKKEYIELSADPVF